MINVDKQVLQKISEYERLSVDKLNVGIQDGTIVVLSNKNRNMDKPCAVGSGLTTKVNANFGLSEGVSSIKEELEKLDVAVEAGADAVMDLSTGPVIKEVRREILKNCPVPLGTVPVYELACCAEKPLLEMDSKDFLDILRVQAEEGVDFFTIHCGITLAEAAKIKENPRMINVVSRGGAMMTKWMIENNKENPFYANYDEVIDIAREYNIVLSLGDSLRPGTIFDATDSLQIQELIKLGELQQKAFSKGVQVMIEGPGHVPLDQIAANVQLEKSLCNGAPFYVLGPLVTDAAPGYDHIVGAIGGAVAAWNGADFLCYVTPAEHVKLPDIEDVRNGVIASKIAAHAADIVKKIPSALERDRQVSLARANRNWKEQFECAIDPDLPRQIKGEIYSGERRRLYYVQ